MPQAVDALRPILAELDAADRHRLADLMVEAISLLAQAIPAKRKRKR